MADERRKHLRYKIEQFVELSFDEEEYISAEGVNLSKGGLMAKSKTPLDLTQRVFLMLKVETDEGEAHIKTEGVVVHSEKTDKGDYLFGVEFDTLSQHDVHAIENYLKDKEEH